MNRRTVITGMLAIVVTGAGAGIFATSTRLRKTVLDRLLTCAAMEDFRRRITADYENAKIVVTDGWILAESEAELLAAIGRDGEEAAIAAICDNG